MRKTKIICTMGPSTEKGDTLKKNLVCRLQRCLTQRDRKSVLVTLKQAE